MGLLDRLRGTGGPPAEAQSTAVETAEQSATRLLEEGMALEVEAQLDEALQRYDAAIQLTPELARAHFNRGNILLDRGDAEHALAAYTQAIAYKPDSAAAHYNIGNAHLHLGHPEAAVTAYHRAIELKPEFADAHVALGGAQEALGQPEAAAASYRRALAIRPDIAEVHYSLATTLKELGRLNEAVESYSRVLELEPENVDAHSQLGFVLHNLGRLDEAARSYRRALEITPDSVEAHGNLGNVLKELRQYEEAIASYRRVLEIQPESAEAYNNIGNALKDLGQLDDALASYQQALELKPDFAVAHLNFGTALWKLGRLESAAASCQKALEIKPEYPEARITSGNVLLDLGQYIDALASFRKALEIEPDCVDAHINLGVALIFCGQLVDAAASFRRAIQIKPDSEESYVNLGSVLKDLGQLDESLVSTYRALELKPDLAAAHSNLLFIHNYRDNCSTDQRLAEAKRFGEMVARQARASVAWQVQPEVDRCLRVGLISEDLRQHPVGNFLEGVLAALVRHASDRLSFFAYSTQHAADEVTERIKASCRGWQCVVGLSDAQLAERIRADRIDILIDLSGHTSGNRLPMFAWKPAPVQATWLGYLATTGVGAIDYLIADAWTLPESEEVHFTEKIWRLPESYLCFTPPDAAIDVSPLPALSTGQVTFGCFNNLSKMNDAVVALWSRVLHAVPGSRLFLKSPQLKEVSVRNRIVEQFGTHDIDAERLILEGLVPRAEYLVPFQRVDIALDPFPYPGITTSVEALWMGVPVLTLAGERFLSRQGIGLLMNAGLPEWIATDPDDYVARAVSHAGDLHRLAELRRGLRQQVLASPIFDAPRFAGHFEAALRSMWKTWCDAQTGQSGHTKKDSHGTV